MAFVQFLPRRKILVATVRHSCILCPSKAQYILHSKVTEMRLCSWRVFLIVTCVLGVGSSKQCQP